MTSTYDALDKTRVAVQSEAKKRIREEDRSRIHLPVTNMIWGIFRSINERVSEATR